MTQPLRLDAVNVSYRHGRVLDSVSLIAPAGSMTVLVGPSGCGKTTLLRAIAGLVPLDTGDVWLGSEQLTSIPAEQRGIGMVFQRPLLFPNLTVAENVAFGLAMRGVARDEQRTRAKEALDLIQLNGFGDRWPHELSGGQEQRVALARALVITPRVLLLDEPLSALDEHLRGAMRSLIRRLQRQLRITTVLVTHDQREATDIADQIAVQFTGRIAQAAAPRDLHRAPASAEVARFLGWLLLRGHEVSGIFETAIGRLRIPEDVRRPIAVAALCPALLRAAAGSAGEGAGNVIHPIVDRVTDLGHRKRVVLRLDATEEVEVEFPDDACAEFTVGGTLPMLAPPESVRFFPQP